MKQIQPKLIANPSNCGEEIKSTAPKQEYNKGFLLESMMHSSDTDYILGARVKMMILMHQYSC